MHNHRFYSRCNTPRIHYENSVTRAFWKQMGRTGRIPLDLGNEKPNDESLAAICEAEQMMLDGSGESYATAHELIDAALAS